MRFAHARAGDLDELGARAAHQLVDDRRQRPLVGNAALDALGHQLFRGALAFGVLEIAVGAALPHRAQRAHAAVALVRAALVELDVAGRLLGAREQAAEHHARRAGGDGLADVAGIADAAVGDQRNAGLGDPFDGELDRGDLWHADAGHDPRRADRARANADLDGVGVPQIAAIQFAIE